MLRELLDRDHGCDSSGVEPAAVVDLVGNRLGQVGKELGGSPVQHSLVHELQRLAEQLHARSFVHASALGPDDAVLKGVRNADAVAATDGVGLRDHLERRHALAVQSDAAAGLELKLDLLDRVRRLGRPLAHLGLDDEHRRLHALQVLGLVGETGEVGVGRVLLLGADKGLNPKLVQVRRHLGTAGKLLEKPRIAPRRVHGHVRGEHVRVALEAHLVVTAPRGAVGKDSDVFLLHGLHQPRARDEAADTGGIPIVAIVLGLRLNGIKAALSHRLFQVDDDSVDAARRHPVPDVVDVVLIWLAKVSAEGKHLQALLHEALAHSLGVEAT
mmetsp:Transcript_49777/g.119878  ORF Transcript_49777/g.119878 Transcript_49777/m.119878 type:complete len:328 (-) Transcript_49777:134-1117(-)